MNIWRRQVSRKQGPVYETAPFPERLFMSLVWGCNLSCAHCWRSHLRFINYRSKQYMQKEMIDNIVKDFFPRIKELKIGGIDLAEEMLSPNFNYLLDQLRQYPSIFSRLMTNGTLISEEKAELIASTINRVEISLEAVGKNYETIRGCGWERFVNGVDALVKAREKAAKIPPMEMQLYVCVIKELKDDSFELLKFAKKKNINHVAFMNFVPFLPEERESSFLFFEKEHDDFFKQLKQHADKVGVSAAVPPQINLKNLGPRDCKGPFNSFVILKDGEVRACECGKFKLGEYSHGHNNVLKLWNSKQFTRIRKTVNSNSPLTPCLECPDATGIFNVPTLREGNIATSKRMAMKKPFRRAKQNA